MPGNRLSIVGLLAALLLGCDGGNNRVGGGPAEAGPTAPTMPCSLDVPARVHPADGADHIPPSRPLRIELARPLTPARLAEHSSAVALTDANGAAVALAPRLDASGCTVELQAVPPLRGGTDYRLRVDLAALTGDPAAGTITRRFRTLDLKFLGASFFDSRITAIDRLTETELLGVLRFGGRWVTELALPGRNPGVTIPDSYLRALHRFCEFAVARGQQTLIQIPLFLPDDGLRRALDYLQHRDDGCNRMLFAIGNEVDRIDSDEERYADRFEWPDYLAALRRIVPLLRQRFPDAAIAALDLSSFEEYDDYRALRDWVGPLCASDDPAVRAIDYLSIHFYPYTGAQKLWDMLDMGRRFAAGLRQLPADCPPLLLGEYNTTYQWRPQSTYPGSGGDAFLPLLTLPELLHQQNTIGLLHWSLLEDTTSTLGLFQSPALTPRPVYPGYLLLRPVRNTDPVATRHAPPDLAVSAFADGDTVHLYLGNYQPVFRRGIDLGSDDAAVAIEHPGLPAATLSPLPPFSLTHLHIAGGVIVAERRIGFHDQNITSGPTTADTTPHCIPVADFSEPNKRGDDFIGVDFDQNRKIATGGTPLPVPAADGPELEEMDDLLEVRCGPSPQRCGVSLPLLADTATRAAVDWSEGLSTAAFRLSISNPGDESITLLAQLATTHPASETEIAEAFSSDFSVPAGQTTTLSLPWHWFRQPDAAARSPATALARLAALRLLLRTPRPGDTFQLRRIEICDRATNPE